MDTEITLIVAWLYCKKVKDFREKENEEGEASKFWRGYNILQMSTYGGNHTGHNWVVTCLTSDVLVDVNGYGNGEFIIQIHLEVNRD